MAFLESRKVVAWSLALLFSLVWLQRRYRNRGPRTRDPPEDKNSEKVKERTISFDASESFPSEEPRDSKTSFEVLTSVVSCEKVFKKINSSEVISEETGNCLSSEGSLEGTCHVPLQVEVKTEVNSCKEKETVNTHTSEEEVKEEVSCTDSKKIAEDRTLVKSLKKECSNTVKSSKEQLLPVEETCVFVTCQELEQKANCSTLSSEIISSESTEHTTMEKGVLEEKLASLVLDTMKINDNTKQQSAERDSANQSPSEVMLASPSISNFSDAHSEGSSDSGKGHSDVATSPSRTPAGGSSLAGDSVFSIYEFILPQVMVGRLIGRHGSFIHEIRTSTQTNIFIKRHPDTSKLKICAIEGTQQDIDKALAKIRHKFPIRRFPKLTLEKVTFISLNNPPPLKPEDFHLQLVEGVNNDVILSSLITAAHFFLQQPSHPTYSALSRLNQVMNGVYANTEAPVLENAIKDAVCAAPAMGGWYRAQIVSVDEENGKCDVRFVDYGGYLTMETSLLRQIRGDLLMLPFQAVECHLANVVPVGEDGWSEEARLVVQSLTHGQLLQAQIYDYAEDGIPLVYLYSALGAEIILINEELVGRGFAVIATTPSEE